MSRNRWIAAAAAAVLLAFLLGFVPMWRSARQAESERTALRTEMDSTRWELRLARMEGVLGAALAESHRGNYERARQLMTGFFSRLQEAMPRIVDARQRREAEAILRQRDEIITLLSRAEPESRQRLMLLYTRYFEAFDPAAREAPATVVPPPVDTIAA